MNGPLPVFVAVLLALAAIPAGVTAPAAPPATATSAPAVGEALAAPTPATDVRAQPNWSNYLALSNPSQQTGFQTVTIDVGGSLAGDSTSLHAHYSANRIDSAYESARTSADRQAALVTAADRIEARIETLETRQERALSAYNDGDITARQFLRELSVIDRGARTLEDAVSRLDSHNGELSTPAVSADRIATFKAQLIPLRGPVRSQVGQAMAGGSSLRVHIETSSDGIALATIVDGNRARYLREAYVPEHRDADGTDQWEGDLGEAVDRFPELYPWTWSHKQSLDIPQTSLNVVGVYPITVTYPTGSPRNTVTTYLDGSTETAFREVQIQDLQTVRFSGTVENTSGDLVVQVNRTYAGGPFEIQVRDNATREPVEASILVNGRSIGGTGSNGHRYAVTPSGTFTVTAVHEGEAVSVTAAPTVSP
jgi:hypothetical protein